MRCQRWSELRKECFEKAFKPKETPSLEGLLGIRKGYLVVASIGTSFDGKID